jgi:hypothetical protein
MGERRGLVGELSGFRDVFRMKKSTVCFGSSVSIKKIISILMGFTGISFHLFVCDIVNFSVL